MNHKGKRGPRPPSEREIEGLFRLVGEGANPGVPVSDEEAEFLLRMGEQMSISEEEIEQGTQWLLDRLQSDKNDRADMPDIESGRPAPVAREAVPNVYQRCRELKLEAREIAEDLRINEEILIQLDQRRARSVPRILLEGLAAALHTSVDQIRHCFTPADGGALPMAAHGRRGAARGKLAVVEFLTIIQTSSLSDEYKCYWWEVVAAEEAGV